MMMAENATKTNVERFSSHKNFKSRQINALVVPPLRLNRLIVSKENLVVRTG